MKQSLQLRLGQQLVMTPQLQQALRLLQLPVLELNTQLQQALAENVMLEQEEPADSEEATTTSLEDLPADARQEVIVREADDAGPWDVRDRSASRSDPWADDYRRPEPADHSDESLREHLLWQLELENFPPREAAIGQAIIDALNEDGYLLEPLEEILATLPADGAFSLLEVERALARVQSLDPAGVGARDLAECIRIQLEQLDAGTPARALALRIAADGLDAVASRELDQLRRRLEVSEAELAEALQRHPGRVRPPAGRPLDRRGQQLRRTPPASQPGLRRPAQGGGWPRDTAPPVAGGALPRAQPGNP